MQLIMNRFSMRQHHNTLWRALLAFPALAGLVTHEAQAFCALHMARWKDQRLAMQFARGLFARPLMGAGYSWESRMPLPMDPTSTIPLVTTGANTVNFMVHDHYNVQEILFAWQVAGTVTALKLYFDLYSGPTATGTKSASLDVTLVGGHAASQRAPASIYGTGTP